MKNLSRRNDPITSKLAAQQMAEDGSLYTQRELVLGLLERYNMKYGHPTSAELASWGHLERYTASRRLPDLEKQGNVSRLEPRMCSVTGKRCITWAINNLKGCHRA